MKYLHAITLTATAAAITTPVAAEDPYDIIWLTEIGSPGAEFSYEMAVDSTGNVYVGGETDGVLGSARLGGWDAFLAKFDADGSFVWVQQFGTTEDDFGIGVDVDTAGNIYFSGHTKGDLGGMTGKTDAFLAKFDSSGAVQWITQYGAPASFCYGGEVVLDAAGNAIVSGSMAVDPDRDAYAAKFDTTGKMIWISQIGSAHWDSAGGVAIDDSGNVYVCGYTEGDLGGPSAGGNDAFLAKFDSFGATLWIEQFGTSQGDRGKGIAVDQLGNAYVTGKSGPLNGFLARFDPFGSMLWMETIEEVSTDLSDGLAVTVDREGHAYVAGEYGRIGVGPEAFLAKFDPTGAMRWMRLVDSTRGSEAHGVALDAAGAAYLSGRTPGWPTDVFVAKLSGSDCYADCDGDGILDLFDFLCFQNLFALGDPAADCNGDTILDLFDFLCFQNEFAAGCPG